MNLGKQRLPRAALLAAPISALLLSSALAVSLPSSGATTAPKPVLTIGLGFGPASLDPAKDEIGPQSIMRSLTNESITHLNTNGSLSPGLATSWHYVGSGNRTFQFTLRQDARFSDGTPVNAAAVKAWLTYFQKTDGSFVANMGPIASIGTAGQWTVVLHLGKPNPIVPLILSEWDNWGAVSGPTALAKPSLLGTETDGAGPYMVDPSESETGSTYTLLPNPYYYDPSGIKWSKVVVKIISTPTTMLAALKTGQVDVAYGDSTTAAAAAAANFNIVYSTTGIEAWVFVGRGGAISKPLQNVMVRQALNYAINRKLITSAIEGKYATPSSEIALTDAMSPTYENYYSYDPAKAKALLAKAGYPHGFTMTLAEASFVGNLGVPLAEAVAQQLSAIGVDVKITQTSTNSEFVTDALDGKFDAFQETAGDWPTSIAYALEFSPTSAVNPLHADDPVLDKLATEAQTSGNASSIFRQMAARITTQADWLPIFETDWLYYVSPHVGGVSVSELSLFPYASEWYPK